MNQREFSPAKISKNHKHCGKTDFLTSYNFRKWKLHVSNKYLYLFYNS